MTSYHKLRIVVSVSGRGRSLENLWTISQMPTSRYQIVGVIASNSNCLAIEFARSNTIPTFHGSFKKNTYPDGLERFLKELKTDWIFLAGFIKIFPVLTSYRGKTINIHPSLLPRHGGKGMYGKKVHESVVASGDKKSGATIHIVTEEYDKGPILAQVVVNAEGLSPSSLAQKVFDAEKDLYPKVATWLAEGKLPKSAPIVYNFIEEQI